jgi:hypothetical protein
LVTLGFQPFSDIVEWVWSLATIIVTKYRGRLGLAISEALVLCKTYFNLEDMREIRSQVESMFEASVIDSALVEGVSVEDVVGEDPLGEDEAMEFGEGWERMCPPQSLD